MRRLSLVPGDQGELRRNGFTRSHGATEAHGVAVSVELFERISERYGCSIGRRALRADGRDVRERKYKPLIASNAVFSYIASAAFGGQSNSRLRGSVAPC